MSMDTVDRLNGLFHEYLEYFAGQMSFHRLNTRMSVLYCAYGLSKNLVERTSYHTPRIYTGEFQNEHTKNTRKIKNILLHIWNESYISSGATGRTGGCLCAFFHARSNIRFIMNLKIRECQTVTKGQLISRGNFGVFNSSKKRTWKF